MRMNVAAIILVLTTQSAIAGSSGSGVAVGWSSQQASAGAALNAQEGANVATEALRAFLGITETAATKAAGAFSYVVTLLPTAIIQVEEEMPGSIEQQVVGLEAIANTAESAPANPAPTTWGEAFGRAAIKSDNAASSN